MTRFQLCVLLSLGFITLINCQCVVNVQNGTVSNDGSSCSSFSNSTLNSTLTCSGIRLSDSSQGNLNNLKAFTDSAFHLYTLLRSRLDVGLVVSNINNVRANGSIVGSLSDVGFARLWFQVKLSPYLTSFSRDTLSCLSQSNLTCQSFQALVKDLSLQISSERHRMVYQNFIKPFLARNTTDAGCANGTASTVDWLFLNFQTFSTNASLADFIALKPDFNGLVVLDKLTPEQKAELIFQLEARASLNATAVNQIFQSFLQPLTNITLNITSASSESTKNLTDFLIYLRPLGRFIRSFVNIAQTTNISSIRNETIQLLVNWTRSISTNESSVNTFNIRNISDWFQSVVIPVMKKYLQTNQSLPDNTTDIINFTLAAEAQAADPVETCKVTSNNGSCHISQTGESLAKTITCVAQSNLNFTEENLQLLITELSRPLQTQMEQSVTSQSYLATLFGELPAESFTTGNLDDVEFMKFWFQIKMKPLLPKIPREFLSCFSARTFSCQAYRTLFQELNNNVGLMDRDAQRSVLNDFIVPFLSQRQNKAVDCTSPFNNSVDFILKNFGSFSPFAQLQLFSNLSTNFSAVEAVSVLTLVQLSELVFSPPAKPEDRAKILTKVFDFLLQDSNRDKLNSFIPFLQTQARKANFSCENYNIIFDRMDQTLSSVSSNQSEAVLTIRDSVMMILPDECIIRSSQCTTTPVNESAVCASVNSSTVGQFLNGSPSNASGPLNVCNFTLQEYACLPTLSQLNSQQLADLLACKLPSNVTKDTWKLFFTKTSTNLDGALLKLSNMTLSPSNVSLSDVLDVIADVRIDRFSPQRLRDPVFIRSWFQGRLKAFLPAVSQRLLSCLSTKNLTCESYRTITEAFVNATLQDGQDVCNLPVTNATQKQELVYTEFMKAFLSRNDTEDPRCLRDTVNITQWAYRNFGPFLQSIPLQDLVALNINFTKVEVLPLLSPKQLVEFPLTADQLSDPQRANNVMQLVRDCQLPIFFDRLFPKVQNVSSVSSDVKAALIKQIFDRANLSNVNIRDEEVEIWFSNRLKPLFNNLSESLVSPFFTILRARNCNITQSGLKLLKEVQSSVSINTKNAIYNDILQSFRAPQPLRCYTNNSFITFLNGSLFGYGPLPNVTTFISLIPPTQRSELVNSFTPSELGIYLRQPAVVNNDSQICVIFKNFVRTPEFLDTEDIPDNLKSTILPCVWPLALRSDNQTEIDLWFGRRLGSYLKFLNKDLLGSTDTLGASCLSYMKMVSVLSNFNLTGSQISSKDVYTTIKTYLKADAEPKCYNISDARLNSTAWFFNYIGVFIIYLSVDDLNSFGPESTMKTFAVNPENIKLFNQNIPPKNVSSRYTQLIFLQNPSFNLTDLPPVLQCDAPATVFTSLSETQSSTILGNFKSFCSDVDPAISTALAGNIKTINTDAIKNLGNEVVGLTTTQINSAPPEVLISSISTLGNVSGWNFGQTKAVIEVFLSSSFQFSNPTNLINLGSLVTGIPSTVLTNIDPQQILITSQNPQFVQNIQAAPEIVQMTYVKQILKVNTSPAVLMTNVPNDLAVQIPRNLLEIPNTIDVTDLKKFNNKKWKPDQAVLFFDTVSNAFDQSDDLSVDVLQGFTCSRVQTFSQTKIRGLIRACRWRQGRPKVVLKETQLTCMYNLIRKESPLDFSIYHPDMLLYYNYDTINQTTCKAYFAAVGGADLSVFSSTLRGRRDILWSKALDCFGINGTSIKKEDLTVLGNLICVASSDYIANSDPEILENLKNCNELSDAQISAMETLVIKGTTQYGPQGKWNQKTLNDLGILPLYFSQTFWSSFKKSDSGKYLKGFLKFLRGRNTPKLQMKKLFKAIIIPVKIAKRATGCTVGPITSVTISDDAFPFGYDESQFSSCLSATVARENLANLCEKIDDSGFQRVILDKLKEILPNGLSDDQVQVLKSVSRNATVDEISKWNITKSDTLAALMNANDGEWSCAQSKLIITKYLSANNSLTATELNLVKGPNLCCPDDTILITISPESIRGADALNVSKCSSANKKTLFPIANKAFPMTTVKDNRAILSAFQLIESYLGGADLGYIRNLSLYNVSMSLATFINLDTDVINSLTVSEVQGLLGNNLQDLKTFENQTSVRSWISRQLQSDLDKLNIGLTGGKATAGTTTAVASSITTQASNSTAAGMTLITTKATVASNSPPGIGRGGWSVSFSLLVLILTFIKMEII